MHTMIWFAILRRVSIKVWHIQENLTSTLSATMAPKLTIIVMYKQNPSTETHCKFSHIIHQMPSTWWSTAMEISVDVV